MAEENKTTKETAIKAEPKKSTPKTVKAVSSENQDKFAVIKTGGKQYLVSEGRFYNFEKIEAEEGASVTFEEVLLVVNGQDVKLGKPVVTGAKVTGKILSQFRDSKVKIVKFKKRKDYRRTKGHRQHLSKVEITKIS